MAQDPINVGTLPNDRTGDLWRNAFIKVNANETELFTKINAQSFIFIDGDDKFENTTPTEILLEANKIYVTSGSYTTDKKFIGGQGSVMTAFNIFGPVITYTGSGDMFSGTDIDFSLLSQSVSCPNANAINFSDTVGGVRNLSIINVRVLQCLKFGTVNDLVSVEIFNGGTFCTNGLEVIGDKYRVLDIDNFVFLSLSTSLKAVDFGTSTLPNIKVNDMICEAPAGAFGISGQVNNGNVDVGSIATVKGCSFSGGMTDLENITIDDVRWVFEGNSPTEDTFPDALIGFNGNSTETVITTGSGDLDNPIPITATYVEERASHFTTTSDGKMKYVGERPIRGPIDLNFGLIAAGGGSKNIRVHLAKNGSVIANAFRDVTISGSDPNQVTLPWQARLVEDDELQVYVENRDDEVNIIGEFGTLRIR